MRRCGWIRLSAMWAAPLLLAAIIFAWARSYRQMLVFQGPGNTFIDFDSGRICAGLQTEVDPGERFRIVAFNAPNVARVQLQWSWRFEWHWNQLYKYVSLPLWVPAGMLAIGAGIGWRRELAARRITRSGACAKCGYLKAGLSAGSLCPECGAG